MPALVPPAPESALLKVMFAPSAPRKRTLLLPATPPAMVSDPAPPVASALMRVLPANVIAPFQVFVPPTLRRAPLLPPTPVPLSDNASEA